jgi:ABC-type nickel/cobalt efflux system permease component RcnA
MQARTRPLAARGATALAFLLFAATGLAANPFIGTDSSPQVAPVLAGGPTTPSLIQGQLDLRQRLADYLGSWQGSHSASLLLVILGVSFLYGALHALGPGHRKTVVFSIYLARKAPWWEPLASSLALAGLHGGAAIVLLLVFRGVSGAISASTDSIATYMEGGAYTALIVMALVLLVRAIVDLVKGKESKDGAMSLGTLILTGIYPCPGAILVLVLSLSLDIMRIGILAVLAMSLGMSVPIAVFAYFGWAGRAGLLKRLKNNEAAIQKAGTMLEIGGFSLLLAFSVYLALPFIASVARLI